MQRTRISKWLLAACLLLVWTAAVQAESLPASLLASYNAIFLADGGDDAVDDPGDDIGDEDGDFGSNIYCCTHTGSCVSTSTEKCVKAADQGGYGGTAHASLLKCRQAGCQ